jgi:primosomal protein N' (replication factor Y)
VLHSGLTAAQRHQQWLAIRDGWAQVVVGARSAVFAPTEKLGLIVVDEEHDGSYKQDQAPRYHGRDVAIKRAHMHEIPIVLGSATPSLESYYNATQRGSSHLLQLPNRVTEQALPHVEIVDMLEERRQRQHVGDRAMHLLSRRMEKGLQQTFDAGGQAILLLNRRGYASYIACPDQACGWIMACEHCDVNLVYHKDPRTKYGGVMRCHYCGFENRLPSLCPLCSKKTSVFGLGTQRVEEELSRKLPGVRLLRMDSDAMRTGRDYHEALETFRRHEIDLLVGTQMIAKGLDFPNVQLVGVISADTALHLPDFRAAERTFQLVSQVAGRSGRGAKPGRVIVQTFTPDAPPVTYAAKHDFAGFAQAELDQRQRTGLPPTTRMARVVCRDRDLDKALAAADALNGVLLAVNEALSIGAQVLGPLTPPIARIGGYHRVQIEIIAANAGRLQKLLAETRQRGALTSDAHMAVDVDPISLL